MSLSLNLPAKLAASGGLAAAAATASALALSGGASAQTRPVSNADRAARSASPSTVISSRSTKLGKILVDSRGIVVYGFSRDSRNKDACQRINGCLHFWPLVTVDGKLTAGRGVNQKMLGSIKVRGKRQVTYDGHPLYGYIENVGPGNTGYVGVFQSGGTWPAVRTNGTLVN
jgi:predicted lipoprotein with Yx(FWY)xxD motif